MSALLRLYPRTWRARYGSELEELMALRPLGLNGQLDLIRGAVDAHLHPELVDPLSRRAPAGLEPVTRQRFEDLRVARRLGRAAWVGSALWIAGWVIAANGPLVFDGHGSYRDGSAGMPFVLLAMALLSAGLLGQLVRLPRSLRVARVGAIVAACTLPFFGMAPWVLPIGAVALVGMIVAAVAAAKARQWSWRAASALVIPGLGGSAVVTWTLFGFGGDRAEVYGPLLIAVLAFTPIWLVVGATLQSLPKVIDPDSGAWLGTKAPAGA